VTCVIVNLSLRHITLVGFRAGREEDLIVLTPDDKEARLMLFQVFL
jgi:hypothetical protein